MNDFVLIPGAWLGDWCWIPVAENITKQGFNVHSMTLTGLDPDDDVPVANIGLKTHVDDVLRLLEKRNIRDAALVGHSYAGIVAGMVALQAPERVAHTIFIDAFLPNDGKSMADAFDPEARAQIFDHIERNNGRWAPPTIEQFEEHSLPNDRATWMARNAQGHPGRTIKEPATVSRPLAELSATYIKCTEPFGELYTDDVEELRQNSDWSFMATDTGHWPMVSQFEKLSFMLTHAYHYQKR